MLPKFLPSPVFAGEDVKLCIKAKPNSVCGVSLIDLNVLARADVSNLDANQVTGDMKQRGAWGIVQDL